MPHEPRHIDLLDVTIAEMQRLRDENAQLRAFVADMSAEIGKIAEELKKAIDKDNR